MGPRTSPDPFAQGALATPVAGAPWRVLLSGTAQELAVATARALLDHPDGRSTTGSEDASLSGGAAGIALAHALRAVIDDDAHAANRARASLDRAVDALGTQPMTPSLFAGFTGVAWAAQQVDRLLGDDGEDRNEAIDEAVRGLTPRYAGDDTPYELIQGLTGLGVYALARLPRPAGAEILAAVVQQLADRARLDRDGAYWWTPPSLLVGARRNAFPDGGVDLGMAHGMAAVLPLLAGTAALGIAPQTAGPLLDDAVRWLTAHLVDTPWGPSVPAFLADGVAPGPSRAAWCYGDPGVAVALLVAARYAGRPDWADTAVALAGTAAARPPETTGVVDAGLCHGAAGLAHLFNRLHQMTGVPALADAARSWSGRTVDMCAAVLPPRVAAVEDAGLPWNGAGVLEGRVGIALALLAAGTAVEPVWDRMLLVATGGPRGDGAPV
jgi:hypothetical protein